MTGCVTPALHYSHAGSGVTPSHVLLTPMSPEPLDPRGTRALPAPLARPASQEPRDPLGRRGTRATLGRPVRRASQVVRDPLGLRALRAPLDRPASLALQAPPDRRQLPLANLRPSDIVWLGARAHAVDRRRRRNGTITRPERLAVPPARCV